tara:strand:+ start:2233 stop:2679 length:447 start_codon:yes stop_codon:yes gene_type:complete
VSKYRVEFKSSKLWLILQLLIYGLLVLSVLNWQSEIIQYQFFLEILIVCIISIFIFRAVLHNRRQTLSPIILSLQGEWLETNINEQISWKITSRSRVSSLVLFIHLISPINARHSKWCLIYRDQVTERDFRRLCCAVIYQQQTTGNID